MNALLLILAIGPYWSIAPDGSLIVVTPPSDPPMIEIVIDEPPPTKTIVRLPGPRHPGPHGSCQMCLAEHLKVSHGYDRSYINAVTYRQIGVLHDNSHNSPMFSGHGSKPAGKGSTFMVGYGSSRRQLFRKVRRRR